MAKFAYSVLFDNGTLSAAVDADIDRLAQSGRVAPIFVAAVKAKYGIDVPATKAAFLTFRAAHVKFASLPAEERAKLDDKPALWVPGHLLRSRMFGALDGIAAGLTSCERMADSANWGALFAPAPKAKAPTAPKAPAPVLPSPVATFPAIGAAPKSGGAGGAAAGGAAAGGAAAGFPMSMSDMVDALESLLKAGAVPGDMRLRLQRALTASAQATAPGTVDPLAKVKATPPTRPLATAPADEAMAQSDKAPF